MVSPVARIEILWNRSPSSFPKKRAHSRAVTQEEMRYEGSPVKAPRITRTRITPPAPMQKLVHLL